MVLQWTDRGCERPDPYLDWEVVNRTARAESGERWCSVLVQLDQATGSDAAAHLKNLRDELANQPQAGIWTLRAHDDEVARLGACIALIQGGTYPPSGSDDPGLSFFVYMPETRAYANGAYAHTANYKIRLVGPPIPGLRFNQQAGLVPQFYIQQFRRADAKPVAIGIIDHAIAFANERFRSRFGCAATDVDRSRVKHLWLQHVERAGPDPAGAVLFGRALDARDIDAALSASAAKTGAINEDAVYASTGAVDFALGSRQATARRGGHGTHVMDLAAGYASDDPAGEDRPILAVQLPEPATLDTSGVTMASYVLQGLRQIMLWADTIEDRPLPLVVNFSYGIFAGPKDGGHILEREMARLIDARNRTTPTSVVLPAGNTYLSRVTGRMVLRAKEEKSIDWIIQPDGGMPSFLEIWMDAAIDAATVGVRIAPPGAAGWSVSVPASGAATVLNDGGRPVGALYFDVAANGAAAVRPLSRIVLAINPTRSFNRKQPLAASGCWRVTIANLDRASVELDLFVQREDTPPGDQPPGRQSYFDDLDGYHWDGKTGNYDGLGAQCVISHENTLSAIATSPGMIVVGGAMAAVDGTPPEPSEYASSGPTHARYGPDFAAISDDGTAHRGVLAAGTRSGSVVAIDGTSIAAPQITRLLADAGASMEKLKASLGVGGGGVQDRRLGWVVAPKAKRRHIPERKRS